jgi:thioredoxin 1
MIKKIQLSMVWMLVCASISSLEGMPLRNSIAPSTQANKKKNQQTSEYKRLHMALEEQSPGLQKLFEAHAEKILLGAPLKTSDKKALQSFLKTVTNDIDLHPSDKKAIHQFFKRGLSTAAKIGIGVGSATAIAALVALTVVIKRTRTAQKTQAGKGRTGALSTVTPHNSLQSPQPGRGNPGPHTLQVHERPAQTGPSRSVSSVSNVEQITSKKAFDDLLAKATKPVIVYFYIDCVKPCNIMTPIYEEMAERYKDRATFIKINSDNDRDNISQSYQISKPPVVIAVQNSNEVDRITEPFTTKDFKQWLSERLDRAA